MPRRVVSTSGSSGKRDTPAKGATEGASASARDSYVNQTLAIPAWGEQLAAFPWSAPHPHLVRVEQTAGSIGASAAPAIARSSRRLTPVVRLPRGLFGTRVATGEAAVAWRTLAACDGAYDRTSDGSRLERAAPGALLFPAVSSHGGDRVILLAGRSARARAAFAAGLGRHAASRQACPPSAGGPRCSRLKKRG